MIGRGFFEGWYFKHCTDGRVFAAIPGRAIDRNGGGIAFVQTITGEGTRYEKFPLSAFRLRTDPFCVEVGDNRFSAEGLSLHLPGVSAEFSYGAPTPLTGGDIMGPFARVPWMECRHGVVSLNHTANGWVRDNDTYQSFDGGFGYIELDNGRSFPDQWVWVQCNAFVGQPGDCLMLAVAKVPFIGLRFTGILCVVRAGHEQHRIATYRGARVLYERAGPGEYEIEVGQGGYRLTVRIGYEVGKALLAPAKGAMNRTIEEQPCCEITASLTRNGSTAFIGRGDCCGFERAGWDGPRV